MFRTQSYLAQSLSDAKSGGYSLGVKLVRGAYHDQERALHKSSGSTAPDPPVWATKDQTDECFNACLKTLVNEISIDIKHPKPSGPTIAALFGTHNVHSCNLLLDELIGRALAISEKVEGQEVLHIGAAVTDRISVAQLYG